MDHLDGFDGRFVDSAEMPVNLGELPARCSFRRRTPMGCGELSEELSENNHKDSSSSHPELGQHAP